MKNATCDPEEHHRIMSQWDQAIQEVDNLVSPFADDDDAGVVFPVQSHACVKQYGTMYAERYAQVFDPLMHILSDGNQGNDNSDHSLGDTRFRRSAGMDCRFCCSCCPGMSGCGVCCRF